jgi:alpha-beta hydrolase superfamily lysophospholipase
MTSTTSQLVAEDGLGLLLRHWECPAPKARILLIHGIGEHSGRWEHVGDFFAAEGFDVTGFDLRGHGASGGDRMDVESFEQYLDDVELVLDHVPADLPRIIYGHSLGGLIAVSYGVSKREQPDLFVLSAPALAADVPIYLRWAARLLSRAAPGLRLANSIKGEQLSRDPAVGEKYFADPLVQTKATTRLGAALFSQMDWLHDRYGELSRPALVIHGAEDPLVPPQASAPLAVLDKVDRKLFPGLRHETHNEPEQEEVLGFVAAWLDDHLG